MNLSLFIARRLRLAPDGGGRRSPAVGIAVTGVALAVAVMIISMAVVLGFQDAIRDKVSGFEASLTLGPLGKYYEGEAETVDFSDTMRGVLAATLPDAAVAPVLRQPAVIKTPDDFSGVVLRAYGEGHDYSFERSNILEGSLPEQNTDLMISALTSRQLGLSMGDKVDVCFFIDGALKLRRLSVCGIYSSNFGDYDRLTAYVTYPMLQRLRRLPDTIADEIEIRNVPFDQVSDASALVQKKLTEKYDAGELQGGVTVTTLYDTGAVYFNWLGLLDANVVVILIIMSLVSGFTLISCVFILILQRVRMIGVLKSLGATDGQIRRVFILLGIRVVGLGLLIGDVAGVTLVLLQNRFHAVPLNPEAYFLTYVPVELTWQQLLLVNCGALLLAALLLLVPAQLVSRISPAKTMHFE